MTALGFCDVQVSYNGIEAVQSFNDLLHSGEWLCLIGPNGAGKSSVLRAAAGLVPYSGSIAIDQKEIPQHRLVGERNILPMFLNHR